MNTDRRMPAWLSACLTVLRTLAGIGDLAWEFGIDRLHHWPPTFVLAFWLMGGPVESLITFFTSGRIQINVRPKDEKDDR